MVDILIKAPGSEVDVVLEVALYISTNFSPNAFTEAGDTIP